ncbi:hypothetical protein ACP4OV_016841 [Aristida adscensionis]
MRAWSGTSGLGPAAAAAAPPPLGLGDAGAAAAAAAALAKVLERVWREGGGGETALETALERTRDSAAAAAPAAEEMREAAARHRDMAAVSSSRFGGCCGRGGGGGDGYGSPLDGSVGAPRGVHAADARRRLLGRRQGWGSVCVFVGGRVGCNGETKDQMEERIRRRGALAFLLASPVLSVAFSAHGKTKNMNPYDERRLLEQNKKIQEANRAPDDFPNFIREGFQVKVVTSDNYITSDSGLMYEDIKVGTGNSPKDGQQIIFHYVGYNEAGRRIDSTYIQGSPAKIRLGNKTLVPGKYTATMVSSSASVCWTSLIFEEGIRDMKPGGKRRLIIPPELGPPVGPSTFFSAKQFEVFDVELLAVQDCQRRTIAFYSDVVCS